MAFCVLAFCVLHLDIGAGNAMPQSSLILCVIQCRPANQIVKLRPTVGLNHQGWRPPLWVSSLILATLFGDPRQLGAVVASLHVAKGRSVVRLGNPCPHSALFATVFPTLVGFASGYYLLVRMPYGQAGGRVGA